MKRYDCGELAGEMWEDEEGDWVRHEDLELNESQETPEAVVTLNNLLAEAKVMIDGAYDIVEIWNTDGSPYNKKWKKDWLGKARDKFGATPSL